MGNLQLPSKSIDIDECLEFVAIDIEFEAQAMQQNSFAASISIHAGFDWRLTAEQRKRRSHPGQRIDGQAFTLHPRARLGRHASNADESNAVDY
ncbi:hypothetical protein ABIE62_002845 [Porphyrobacter sp. MBR-155]|jgi:hypothetical protein|uniref:hypothetical protein n=1 Tax=Porphyrobacter sp. MBR-155 TaxID=3156464 RepID=UPI00339412F6